MNESKELISTTDENTNVETLPLTRLAKLRLNARKLLSNVKGSTTIEKIIIIAVFCFAIVSGVRALATSTETTLSAQGAQVAKFAK
ncbi:MAG TPA: hypothetical protein VGG33_22125 [Polyangia bacterium]